MGVVEVAAAWSTLFGATSVFWCCRLMQTLPAAALRLTAGAVGADKCDHNAAVWQPEPATLFTRVCGAHDHCSSLTVWIEYSAYQTLPSLSLLLLQWHYWRLRHGHMEAFTSSGPWPAECIPIRPPHLQLVCLPARSVCGRPWIFALLFLQECSCAGLVRAFH
jgi:hypothetical protein